MTSQSDLKGFMNLIKVVYILMAILITTSCAVLLLIKFGDKNVVYITLGLNLICLFVLFILICNTHIRFRQIISNALGAEKALRSSETKYQSMVENIQIGFARSTPGSQGQYIEVNTYFAKMLGYSREELIQMPVAELYKEKSKRKEFSDKLCKMEWVRDEELLLSKKDGSAITVSATGQAVRDENNKVAFFDLILEDITRKKMDNEEAIKNEKLSSIGILAGGIAHDFNNILTGLYGNIALAKLDLDPSTEAAQLIHDAELSMSKATDLTQQLLIFAKGGDPIKETIPVDQTIQEAAKFNLSGSNIRLETFFDENLWQVNADKAQISQVISNLVINARHAMPDGGILSIKAKNVILKNDEVATLPGGFYLKITLQDQGIGIPEDCISKIFDPYFTTKHTGSGMGLATSFSIIKKHNGWITAGSGINKGAKFIIYLPAEEEFTEASLTELSSDSAKITSANILLMDDDKQVCAIAEKMIKLFGYTCHVVHDGKDALQLYENSFKEGSPFDLVLMDLTIPGGMGGKETIVKILDIDPDAKAIVISGYSNDPILANHRDYGFKGMLVKPFKMAQLKKAIDKAILNLSDHM